MTDAARRLLIYSAALLGIGGSGGFAGGRMTAPATPFEVRFVHIPPPAPLAPLAEVTPLEPVPVPPVATAPITPLEPVPEVSAPPELEEKPPLPQPRPKIEAKPKERPKPPPKPEREAPAKKARAPARPALPSCAVVKREYEAMTWPQRMAAYHKATPEEIAHGKRCLGF